MHLTASPHPGASVLFLVGRLDQTSADDFLNALQPYLDSCTADTFPLILELSGVDYISSIGLRALVIAARQLRVSRGKFAIAALQAPVREVFGIAQFDLIIPCFATVDSAIEGLSA